MAAVVYNCMQPIVDTIVLKSKSHTFSLFEWIPLLWIMDFRRIFAHFYLMHAKSVLLEYFTHIDYCL